MQPKSKPEKTAAVSSIKSATFIGPLPPPQHLEHYEKTLPGAADRILTMAEKQQDSRIKAENKVLQTYSLARILGLCFAFFIFIMCLSLSAYALYLDKLTFSLLTFFAGLTGATISFITGKPKDSTNKNNKDGNRK